MTADAVLLPGIGSVGGVNVVLPETTSSLGHTFYAGRNHIDGAAALDYARQPSLSEDGRVLRQPAIERHQYRRGIGIPYCLAELVELHGATSDR